MVDYSIEMVMNMGCLDERQWASCLQGSHPRCLVPVVDSSSLYLGLGPDQQSDRGPDFHLLLLNARLVNNKASLICNLISEKQI